MVQSRLTPVADPVRGWLALSLVAAALWFLPVPSWVVETFYSRDVYPWLQDLVTFVTNLARVAVIDLVIGLAIGLVVFRAARLFQLAWHRRPVDAASELVRRLLRGVAIVLILFVSEWGCNYRRVPLESALASGAVTTISVDELTHAISDADALAGALRPAVIAQPSRSFDELARDLQVPMATALAELNQAPLMRPGRPKFSLLLSPLLTWSGVDGMIDPLALESIINPDLLPYERPFVLAHEWSHLAGRADEAEASAVGWFACMHGPPPLAYSASLYLILEAGGSLPADARRHAYAHLDPGVRTDLVAIGRRLQQEKPRVQQAASAVYDHYLKANQVADGNASYSRALTLILADPIHGALDGYRQPPR